MNITIDIPVEVAACIGDEAAVNDFILARLKECYVANKYNELETSNAQVKEGIVLDADTLLNIVK